jgi:hypothetical protein
METLRDALTNLTRSQRGWLGGGLAAVVILFTTVLVVSGDSPAETTTTTTLAGSTTEPPADTTTTSSSTTPSTSTTLPTATWPLTGLPAEEGETAILAVKIDNTVTSRPQQGLEMADLVFDIPVEGGISRLLALFQSQVAEEVGPVRSVREVDPKLLAPFDAYVAHSGGNVGVIEQLREVATDIGHPVLGSAAYRRSPDRPAPYDLMFDTAAGLAAVDDPPTPSLLGLSFGEVLPGESAQTVEITSSIVHQVRYGFSAADGGYLRFHEAQPHLAESGEQVIVTNVVVLVVDQLETGRFDSNGAPVPDFDVLGTGRAVVFRDGRALDGRWERGRPGDFFRLFTDSGGAIDLAPGTTWIHLVPEGGTYEWR